MRICSNCDTHNLDSDGQCHVCGTSLSQPSNLPWKTAILLGVVSTGCLSDKMVGEPEYGVVVSFEDADMDGYNVDEDCDDNDASVGGSTDWYEDSDMDGYGNSDEAFFGCDPPAGYVDNDEDCDDSDEDINPDATEEMGDGVDSNCNDDDDS
jgi:hypothetical protein